MAAIGRRHGVECGRKEERQSASPSAMITRAQNMCLKAEEATRAAERHAEHAALVGNPSSASSLFQRVNTLLVDKAQEKEAALREVSNTSNRIKQLEKQYKKQIASLRVRQTHLTHSYDHPLSTSGRDRDPWNGLRLVDTGVPVPDARQHSLAHRNERGLFAAVSASFSSLWYSADAGCVRCGAKDSPEQHRWTMQIMVFSIRNCVTHWCGQHVQKSFILRFFEASICHCSESCSAAKIPFHVCSSVCSYFPE